MKHLINHIQKFNKLFIYYLLLLLGLCITSWIIWSRFIRARTIREVPDLAFTEYRFWILLYICFIYLYIIKNLIKPTKSNIIFKEIINILYKPLKILDHFIKYNPYIKSYYYKFMFKFLKDFNEWSDFVTDIVVFLVQILPRIILVTFLVIDTFYFHKIEVFYKVILIGLLPFIFRYIKYSMKDILEYWIIELENIYDCVIIYEVGYQFETSRKGNTDAIYHNEEATIREYIEIKFDNYWEFLGDDVTYEYNATPYCKYQIMDEYNLKKYNTTTPVIGVQESVADHNIMRELYHELMPQILLMNNGLFQLEVSVNKKAFKYLRIIIFSMYFICWSYILAKSYFNSSITLEGAQYLISNFMRYLCIVDNPFAELYWGSLNENLFTLDNIKLILKYIIEKCKRIISK